jgi:hypothetical protein
MIWNLMFWFAVAYLGIAIIWRYFVPALSPASSRSRVKTEEAPASGAKHFFARSRFFPIVAVAFLVIPFVMQYNTGWFDFGWSSHEKEQLQHFSSAMDYYDQATDLASVGGLKLEDWESIRALLEASQSEAEQVSDTVLAKIDDDMPALYRDKFMAGLRTGIFGLGQYTLGKPKGAKTLNYQASDSLDVGRRLLSDWDDWYLPRQQSILNEINPSSSGK